MKTTRWYLVFVGLTTVPVEASNLAEARSQIEDEYQQRGITLQRREVRVRRARPDDEGWLRDAGAAEVADRLSRQS